MIYARRKEIPDDILTWLMRTLETKYVGIAQPRRRMYGHYYQIYDGTRLAVTLRLHRRNDTMDIWVKGVSSSNLDVRINTNGYAKHIIIKLLRQKNRFIFKITVRLYAVNKKRQG